MRKRKFFGYIGFIVAALVIGAFSFYVHADTTTTQVTVSNSAPSFTTLPNEYPTSTSTTPWDAGTQYSFRAIADDPNDDPTYFLAVCKTNAITPNAGGGAPTCDGGAWCVSGATADNTQATCNYTPVFADTESNDWYAFACDAVTGQQCSSSSQGESGTDGASPFKVNHRPVLSSVSGDSALPGGNITISANVADSDIDGTQDQFRMVVCGDATGSYSGCTGISICSTSLTNTSPLTCQYSVPVPTQDQVYNFYAYVYDSHQLASGDATGVLNTPMTGTYTITNELPTVTSVSINNSLNINLTESTTTGVQIKGTISDNNSCQDVPANNIKAYSYRSAVTCGSALDANDNHCYADVTCTIDSGTCSGSSDSTMDVTCTASTWYHADPTDAQSTYETENWLGKITATDESMTPITAVSSTPVELNSLIALVVPASIGYGNIPPGGDSGSTHPTFEVTASGNISLDVELSGTAMTKGADTIPVGNQRYALTTFTYPGSAIPLTTTPTLLEINLPKVITRNDPLNIRNIYWGIGIPGTIASGTYNGTNTVTAVRN